MVAGTVVTDFFPLAKVAHHPVPIISSSSPARSPSLVRRGPFSRSAGFPHSRSARFPHSCSARSPDRSRPGSVGDHRPTVDGAFVPLPARFPYSRSARYPYSRSARSPDRSRPGSDRDLCPTGGAAFALLPTRSPSFVRQGPLLSFGTVPFSRSARSPSHVRQGLQTAAVRAGRRPSPIKRRDICPSRKAGDWPWAFCWRWVVVLYYLHGGCYGYTPRGGIEDEKAENSSSRSPPHPASGPVHGAATRSVAVV